MCLYMLMKSTYMKHEYFEHGDGKYANLYLGYSVCLFYEYLPKIDTEMHVNILLFILEYLKRNTFTLIIGKG
jgi:hypothetical protein